MTITNMVDKFMEWPREMLEHVEFKCSFHYLELKKKKLLEVFAKNANQLWGKGASINIEVTPSDELIPYIEELKNFSYSNFGALPHITIARNDSTKNIGNFCMICFSLLAQPFIKLFFGERMLLSFSTALWLGINLMLTFLIQLPSQVFVIYKLFRYDRPIIITSAVLNIVISIALVNKLGISYNV